MGKLYIYCIYDETLPVFVKVAEDDQVEEEEEAEGEEVEEIKVECSSGARRLNLTAMMKMMVSSASFLNSFKVWFDGNR